MTASNWSDDFPDDLEDDEPDSWEEPEPDDTDPDQVELIACPQCGSPIYEEAEQCPVCGTFVIHDSSLWSGRPWWWIALGVLGILALIWSLFLTT